jgi:hypothetical protein
MWGLVRYHEAEATVPATSSELHGTTSAKLPYRNDQPRQYKLTVYQIVDLKEFRELFDCHSYLISSMSFLMVWCLTK